MTLHRCLSRDCPNLIASDDYCAPCEEMRPEPYPLAGVLNDRVPVAPYIVMAILMAGLILFLVFS